MLGLTLYHCQRQVVDDLFVKCGGLWLAVFENITLRMRYLGMVHKYANNVDCVHYNKSRMEYKKPKIKAIKLYQSTLMLKTLEELQLSTTMLMTLKPIVKDHNEYICFSYYERVVMDTQLFQT